MAAGAIGPQTGLLVRVEMSGSPKNKVGAPLGLIEPGWSVEKIKLMGADAVKLLAQYEPTEPHSAEHQFQLIEHVYAECKKHDILMLLETVAFPFGGEKKTDPGYLNRKAATVIDSARQLSRFCDVYKAEFPGTMGHDSDNQLRENLQALNAASERPWVLLSAGVDYADYYKQVQMAMEAGASGVLGGRAFWKEYFLQDGAAARSQFAGDHRAQTCRRRQHPGSRARHPVAGPLWIHQGNLVGRSVPPKAGTHVMAQRLELGRRAQLQPRERPGKFTDRNRTSLPVMSSRDVSQPSLGEDPDSHRLAQSVIRARALAVAGKHLGGCLPEQRLVGK